ncbi:hypothetical protein [Tomitella biformata]|uniref:hypothetical protein n=1 Tax=Tomitella biformata TaxID=630403 RepID=UPI0004643884|nr:hypothetical protein [Tomitella biformata]
MDLPRSRSYPAQAAAFVIAPLAVAALALSAGCASSSSPSSSTPPGTVSSTAAPTPGSDAATGLSADDEQAITTAFTTFFAGASPAGTKLEYLQDAPNFTATVDAQAGSGLATATTATVSGLLSTDPGQASVTYSILMDGKSVLADQTGVAVQEDGTWKVSAATFCDLLTLENGGTPPAECVGVQLPGASGESTTGAVTTN